MYVSPKAKNLLLLLGVDLVKNNPTFASDEFDYDILIERMEATIENIIDDNTVNSLISEVDYEEYEDNDLEGLEELSEELPEEEDPDDEFLKNAMEMDFDE